MDTLAGPDQALRRLVRDPVVRLAMESDGVTEDEMMQVLRKARWALTMRGDTMCGNTGSGRVHRLHAWNTSEN